MSRFENLRQNLFGLVMHIAERPGQLNGVRTAISKAAEIQGVKTGFLRNFFGEIPPQPDTPQSLVQKDQRIAMPRR